MVTVLLCFAQEKLGIAQLAGMSCVVDGTIPPSSGLSSSSALVCCAGLVTMEANQKSLSKVKGLKKEKKRRIYIQHYICTRKIENLCDLNIVQVELAEICAKSERYIGTEGGGMDQSISFLAENGTVGSFL